MNIKNILLSCVLFFGSLTLSGCYTQLAMFYPDPEIEEFHSYSVARVRPNLSLYARDGAGQSLGMAYQLMYNRFSGFMGFGNRYSYYNPYYYGGYYNDTYTLGGYTMYIPLTPEKTPRTWSRDGKSSTTNLTTTRTTTESSNNDSGQTNSSNISSTRSTSSSTSSSSGGRRTTRRN